MTAPSSRTHFAHPTEHVPACIVTQTIEPRNEECVATRDTARVTCDACLVWLDDLREWAMDTAGSLTVKALADEMPGVHGARKTAVVEWLMGNDVERLAESRRLSTRRGI